MAIRLDKNGNDNNEQENSLSSERFEMLGHFAGGIAHDFNNILSIVEGYTEIAVKRLKSGDLTEEHLSKVLAATQRGADITRQLLAFGRQNIALNDVLDLNKLIEEQEHMLRVILGEQIVLDIQYCKKSLFVESSLENISQILMNLAVNARDAMNYKGEFEIKLSCVDKQVCIKMTDNGCGMDKDTCKKIFQPFFTTKESGQGTGLGLSYVYGIVDQMKGRIDVNSKQEIGTTFEIFLPLSDKKPEPKEESYLFVSGTKDTLKGKTILIAEDEPDLRFVLREMFTDMGMNVLCAGDGNEALVVQEDHLDHIDFLLTDVVMPEMHGAHLAEMFTSLRPDTHVVFMSGYPSFGYEDRIHLPKDATLIAKPLQEEKLTMVLQQCLAGLNKQLH